MFKQTDRSADLTVDVQAAIAEAGFMTGMERNSLQVAMAAFAPLLSHWNDRACPHNMIIFNNHQ